MAIKLELDDKEAWLIVMALRARTGDKPRQLAEKIEKVLMEDKNSR